MTAPHVIVHIPTLLRSHARGEETIEVRAQTVDEALEELGRRHPALVRAVCTESKTVRPHVNVFVNREDIRRLNGLQTPLQPGDAVLILPSISGG